jgi:hypothetical protein
MRNLMGGPTAPVAPGAGWALAAALAAATLPTLLARNVAPSPTFLNQALAFGLWAAFVVAVAPGASRLRAGAPELALLLLGLSVAFSWGLGSLPSTLALSALGTLAAALVLLQAGRSASQRAAGPDVFVLFCWGWLLAGLANVAVSLVQVFAPEWADSQWIAASGLVGRAVGNLRQPNHLSSLLMWGSIAVVVLVQLKRLPWSAGAVLLSAMVFAVVLTASRTGLVSVVLLALWGLLDRRAVPRVRALLIATPLIYAAGWLAMAQWASRTQQAFGGAARLDHRPPLREEVVEAGQRRRGRALDLPQGQQDGGDRLNLVDRRADGAGPARRRGGHVGRDHVLGRAALDVDADRPVVPVDRLAEVIGQGDEVARAEDVHGLAKLNLVTVGHGVCVSGSTAALAARSRPSRSRI